MYRLATIHFVSDRQTDRQTDDIVMTIADHSKVAESQKGDCAICIVPV